jgi:hypothetical protein
MSVGPRPLSGRMRCEGRRTLTIWETPSGRRRRWSRRGHRRASPPFYARLGVLALGSVLLVTMAWKGFQQVLRWSGHASPAPASQPGSNGVARPSDPWQRDVVESIGAATLEAQAGNITRAEMAVDRASSLIEAATIEARRGAPDFFELAIEGLDGTLRPHPDNERLVEHVTLARIELAQLRSLVAGPRDATKVRANPDTTNDAAFAASNRSAEPPGASAPVSEDGGTNDRHVEMGTPRSVAADHVFDPSAAGGDWIDARPLPETAEVLLPPATRLLVDNVRVQNLTIEGAAQTLDGIHWKNVTFVGVRVRYEDGEVDLRNVHFLRCTFGLTTDERGARLASAIALGQTSIVIN